MQCFKLHVHISRNDGYTIWFSIPERNPEQSFDDDEIIEYAEDNNLFCDGGDGNYVNTVDEISDEEFNNFRCL